jgi:hypothetical protein
MHTLHLGRHAEHAVATPGTTTRANPWLWLVGGMVCCSSWCRFVGTDMLGLQPDMYYLIYFTIAVAWFAVSNDQNLWMALGRVT